MLEIKKQYVVDENNQRIAVQIDLDTFANIEEILENYGLAQLMIEADDEPSLSLENAKAEYRKLLEQS